MIIWSDGSWGLLLFWLTDASLPKADADKQRSAAAGEGVDWEGMGATRRSVREHLETLDDAAWGAASEVEPKLVSRSDPAGP